MDIDRGHSSRDCVELLELGNVELVGLRLGRRYPNWYKRIKPDPALTPYTKPLKVVCPVVALVQASRAATAMDSASMAPTTFEMLVAVTASSIGPPP